MEKQQVNVIVVPAHLDALLPAHEGEVAAQFQNESLQLGQDGLFQVFFGEAIFQVQEVQQVGVFQEQRRAGAGALAELGQFLADHSFRLLGDGGALEQQTVHALAQRAHRPA